MNKNKTTVSALDLRPGDVLLGTNRLVLAVVKAGVRIPTGKVEVHMERPNGNRCVGVFGKNTAITILR